MLIARFHRRRLNQFIDRLSGALANAGNSPSLAPKNESPGGRRA